MRCDQFMGVTTEARKYLDSYKVVDRCNKCKRPFPPTLKVIGHFAGMFDNEYDLHEYALSNDWTAREYLQAAPWSSGPCFFLGLKVYDDENRLRRTFEWPEVEIDNC